MKISNKAIVGAVGALAILGAVIATGSGGCLWGLILLCFLVGEVDD